jgi:hypothetical protein
LIHLVLFDRLAELGPTLGLSASVAKCLDLAARHHHHRAGIFSASVNPSDVAFSAIL